APARVDVEVAAMNAMRIDMLDRVRLAGRRVDREHRQIVLAADKDAGLVRRGGAVGDIGKTAAGMQLYGAGGLPAADVAGLGQRVLLVQRRRQQYPVVKLEHVEPVLPFEGDIDPWPGRVEIEMPRPEAVAAVRRH